MTISNFVAYVKQAWKNKPDTSTPLSADRLLHIEDGIKGNSDAIEAIAAAVVSQIVNDPNKIASMAALYAVNQKIGDVANLPNSAADVVTAITQQNSNIESAESIINRYIKMPLITDTSAVMEIINACGKFGMCFQTSASDTGSAAPAGGNYIFYRCSTYGSVTMVEAFIASSNKYYTGYMIGTTWYGWVEH